MRISDWSSDVCSSDLGKVSAVHDCADGGLLVAVTEMALAGNIGAILEPDAGIALHAWAFGEDQARYVVTSANGAEIAIGRASCREECGSTCRSRWSP